WRVRVGMSDTDAKVFGAWLGVTKNFVGEEIPIAYTFLTGSYSIRPSSSFPSPFETGRYTTKQGDGEEIIVHLVPKKTVKNAPIGGLGAVRNVRVVQTKRNGIRVLIFSNGTVFTNTSLETYFPQV
ncbi:MAG: hypothetical protein AAB570_04580, partial [Patescibacteria group bacterium]